MSRLPLLNCLALALVLVAAPSAAATLRVGTVPELEAALEGARPGTRIELAAADFRLERPLVVPDGVRLLGGGRMAVDAAGRAAGLAEGAAATLVLTGDWQGDALSLGDGSELRGLRIVDRGADARPPGTGRRNVVGVGSRRPGDRVAATLRDCEIETDQSFEVGRDGPLGRAIVVSTRSPADAAGPHAGARVRLSIGRSIVRAPRSQALFAVNFASGGIVDVRVRDSLFSGVTSAVGGVPLRRTVSGARTTFESRNSHYRRTGGFDRFGWQLVGGSGVPHEGIGSAGGAERNELVVESRLDSIEGYRVAVHAAAGRRVGAISGPSNHNVARLTFRDLEARGSGDAPVDFEFIAAVSEPAPGGGEVLPPGNSNLLAVDLRGFRVGHGASRYETVRGPGEAVGNRLEFAGEPGRFARSNPAFRPVPGEEFFGR